MEKKVKLLLSSMGITANYTGFYYLTEAVLLSIEEPENLLLITKRIYPQVALKYKTTLAGIERGIRTAIQLAWELNRETIFMLADRELEIRPTPGEFIALLHTWIVYKQEDIA